jgi:transposase
MLRPWPQLGPQAGRAPEATARDRKTVYKQLRRTSLLFSLLLSPLAVDSCILLGCQFIAFRPLFASVLLYCPSRHKGSINTIRFEDFVTDFVLPRCTPFPSRSSVMVMDNCSIHRSDIISKACAKAGVLIRYLPPYSPDFNLIEYSFHDLKAWIRRN